MYRSSPPKVFLGKGVLKVYRKFTGEQPCGSVISRKFLCNFLKSNFGMGDLMQICCIFLEYFFLRTLAEGCFCVHLLKNMLAILNLKENEFFVAI